MYVSEREYTPEEIIVDMLNAEPDLFKRACAADPLRFPTSEDIARWLHSKLAAKGE